MKSLHDFGDSLTRILTRDGLYKVDNVDGLAAKFDRLSLQMDISPLDIESNSELAREIERTASDPQSRQYTPSSRINKHEFKLLVNDIRSLISDLRNERAIQPSLLLPKLEDRLTEMLVDIPVNDDYDVLPECKEKLGEIGNLLFLEILRLGRLNSPRSLTESANTEEATDILKLPAEDAKSLLSKYLARGIEIKKEIKTVRNHDIDEPWEGELPDSLKQSAKKWIEGIPDLLKTVYQCSKYRSYFEFVQSPRWWAPNARYDDISDQIKVCISFLTERIAYIEAFSSYSGTMFIEVEWSRCIYDIHHQVADHAGVNIDEIPEHLLMPPFYPEGSVERREDSLLYPKTKKVSERASVNHDEDAYMAAVDELEKIKSRLKAIIIKNLGINIVSSIPEFTVRRPEYRIDGYGGLCSYIEKSLLAIESVPSKLTEAIALKAITPKRRESLEIIEVSTARNNFVTASGTIQEPETALPEIKPTDDMTPEEKFPVDKKGKYLFPLEDKEPNELIVEIYGDEEICLMIKGTKKKLEGRFPKFPIPPGLYKFLKNIAADGQASAMRQEKKGWEKSLKYTLRMRKKDKRKLFTPAGSAGADMTRYIPVFTCRLRKVKDEKNVRKK